jgi:hypothetical protein
MDITTVIKNMVNDRLEHIFISYTLNQKIENQIKYRLEMLLPLNR